MCNGALARFTVVNRAVAHCFKKVGHPGYRICYKYSRVCTTNQKYIQSAFVDSESVTSHQHPYGPKLDTVPYQCFIPYALFFFRYRSLITTLTIDFDKHFIRPFQISP